MRQDDKKGLFQGDERENGFLQKVDIINCVLRLGYTAKVSIGVARQKPTIVHILGDGGDLRTTSRKKVCLVV